jgi:hypothetical protein
MRAKIVFPAVLAWTLLFLATGQGQTYPSAVPSSQDNNQPPDGIQDYPYSPPPPTPEPPGHLSNWILYHQSDTCYCPVGGNGPIKCEFYINNGLSFPFGNSVYGQTLQTGWEIQGGLRTMFYNTTRDRAWYIDTGIGNTHNDTRQNELRIPLTIIVPNAAGVPTLTTFGQGDIPGVTIRSLDRTYVNLGLGRSWYLRPQTYDSWTVRIDADAGARYGSVDAKFHEIRHRSKPFESAYTGLQSNLEIPCGCCVFFGGLRAEFNYTWTHVLQANKANFPEVNLIFCTGVRY